MDLKKEIELLIEAAAKILPTPFDASQIIVCDRGCPHEKPKLEKGYKAIYTFNYNGSFLKIGKAGPKSKSRFESQHYIIDEKNTKSSLAKSILNDIDSISFIGVGEVSAKNIGEWIQEHCQRIDILVPDDSENGFDLFALNLIEALLHYAYKPRYEGHSSQRSQKKD